MSLEVGTEVIVVIAEKDNPVFGHFAGPNELSQESIDAPEIKQIPFQIRVIGSSGRMG